MTEAEIIRSSREQGLTMIQIIDRLVRHGFLSERKYEPIKGVHMQFQVHKHPPILEAWPFDVL